MAEISLPWDGDSGSTGTGDCGPYTSQEWDDIYKYAIGDGILPGVGSELAVSGTSSPVAVAAGGAFVNGKYYNNSASVDVVVPTPSASTRIDRIVLRADYTAQTVRIARLAGSEGGAAPALTQSDGVTWEISLAQVSITTGGVITVTSERTAADQGRLPGEIAMMYVSSVDASKNPVRSGLTFNKWYLCDGGTYNSRATPNLADRFPIGVGTIASAQGTTGGASTKNLAHTHTGPSHTHTGPSHTHTGPSHTHAVGTLANTGPDATDDVTGGAANPFATSTHTHVITGATAAGGTGNTGASGTGNTGADGTGATSSGGSATQDVMNPYLGVYFFMYSPA